MSEKQDKTIEIFNQIADNYDKINKRLSFGIDRIWRKKTIKYLKKFKSENILDISAGTGELTIELAKLNPTEIIAADPSEKMLEIAVKKFNKHNIKAKTTSCFAENMPFASDYFNLATCAFGIRNFASLQKGLQEIYRVLKPQAIAAILEFGMPKNKLWRFFYKFYFNKILPIRGHKMSKHNFAYSYLNSTVNSFPYGKDMENIFKENGFEILKTKAFSSGIAYLYIIRK